MKIVLQRVTEENARDVFRARGLDIPDVKRQVVTYFACGDEVGGQNEHFYAHICDDPMILNHDWIGLYFYHKAHNDDMTCDHYSLCVNPAEALEVIRRLEGGLPIQALKAEYGDRFHEHG